MATDEHILDNRTRRLVDYLRQHLPASQVFRIVSAYFSVYGYEALQDALSQVDDIRFLFGDPASVGELDPGQKESQSFTLTEDGLSPNRILQQKHLAKACAEWIAGHNVGIRSIGKTNFLHGKMYLAEAEGRWASVVGSSNFTRNGLGCGTGANLEINLATADEATYAELREWFDERNRFQNFVVPQSWRYVRPEEYRSFRRMKHRGRETTGSASVLMATCPNASSDPKFRTGTD